MKDKKAKNPRDAHALTFANPKMEKLFRVRNVKKALDQSRFAFVLGLALYCGFAFLDWIVAPDSFLLSAAVRLCVAPVCIAILLWLSMKSRRRIALWSAIVVVGTQLGHVALVTFGNYPPLYYAVVTSIVIVFTLTFSTFRFIHALLFLAGSLILSALVYAFVLRLSGPDLLFSAYVIGSFTLLSVLAGYSREYYIRQDFLQSDELSGEKRKSEELLLNILPRAVAKELKASGTTKPVSYDGVTVLFADFVGFNQRTTGVGAEPIISALDRYFSYFDFITKKYRLEKIKTIGDAYMLAGGLDSSIPTHAVDCVLAAFDFLDYVRRDGAESDGKLSFELRVGIHTGPVIAGVLGSLKFSYDIFGSTVNVASRMEKYSAANRINVSRNTYELVKDFFECESRGIVAVKNEEKYEMFFVNGIKGELCLDRENNIPNAEFVRLYDELERKGSTGT
jgi:adenylate cyclase